MAAVTSCEIFCTGILRTRGGVVAEWLAPGTPDLEVRGSSLTRRVVSLNKELYCTLSLFTQVYKWVPAIYCQGVTVRWTNIPSRGDQQCSQVLHANEPGVSSGRLGLWLLCAFTFYLILRTHGAISCLGLTSSVGQNTVSMLQGHGLTTHSSLTFFRLSFCNCLKCVLN